MSTLQEGDRMNVESRLSGGCDSRPIKSFILHKIGDRMIGTYHNIIDDPDGNPILGAPNLLTHDQLREMVNLLGESGYDRQILPAGLLVADPDMLVWYRPSLLRPIWFETRTDIDKLHGKLVRWPATLFMAKPSGLSLFALDSDARPEPETRLYRGPWYNVYANGRLCPGSAPFPQVLRPTAATLKAFEDGWYDSSFVHTNLGMKDLTSFPGGHKALWMHLHEHGEEPFPVETLIPLQMDGEDLTFERLLKYNGEIKITGIVETGTQPVDVPAAETDNDTQALAA